MVICSGNYDIIETNTVLLDQPNTRLVLRPMIKGNTLAPIFVDFIYSPNMPADNMNSRLEGNGLVIECINFNNIMGSGTTMPIYIGTWNGKQLKIHIWSYLMGNGMVRKVEYTIFLEL